MAYTQEELMNLKRRGHPDFYRYLESMGMLHDEKNHDYAEGGDPLGNFHRVSAILKIWGYDIPPWLVAAIYALKQQDCVMWTMNQGYTPEVQSLDERVEDEGVYAVLKRILLAEEGSGETEASH